MWKEIIWAVDPYQKDKKVWNHSLAMTQFLATKTNASIQPVYISTPAELRLMTSYEIPSQRRMHDVSLRDVTSALKKVKVKNLKKPQVVVNRKAFSTTEAVETLSRYASRSNAALLVIGTHSKTGLQRFFLGSFAETLLYHAKTPVLLLGPKMKKKAEIKKILFATDFSKESRRVYDCLLTFASSTGAQVHLINVVEDATRWANPFDSMMAGEGSALLEGAIRDQIKASQKKLQKWADDAKGMKVKTSFSVERSLDKIGDVILKKAKAQSADMIAIGTQSGPVRATLGSVARHIVRRSELPVWIAPRHAS